MVTAQRDGEERRAPACLQEMDVSHRKPQVPGQVLEQGHVAPGPANATRLARRHLAEEGLIDGVDPVGDRGDLDDEARPGRAHVAGVLAERPFRLPHTRRDEALDDDLGMGRYLEVVGLAGDHLERLAAQAAGDAELVAAHPSHRRERHGRITPDHDGAGRRSPLLFVLHDVWVHVAPGVAQKDAVLPRPLLHQPIRPHVALAGLGILRDHARRGDVGRGILAPGPDAERELRDVGLVALQHDVLHRAAIHAHGRYRLRLSVRPLVGDLVHGRLEREGVDLGRGPEDSGHQGHREALDALEHHRGPTGRWDPLEHAAHDRGDLPVRIHFLLHVVQLAAPLERAEVIPQVPVGHGGNYN